MTFEEACETYRSGNSVQFAAASEAIIEIARRAPLSVHQAVELAKAMAASGESLLIPRDLTPRVDVPSTGGPASLSTLLCPLFLSALGNYVPKLSATGSVAGGIDTMAVVRGFQTNLYGDAFVAALRKAKFAHSEPSESFCPADTSLIKARRRAKLMSNASLAAASLLAKKLAIPGVACVFDFRVGKSGNIGENLEIARGTAALFYEVAKHLGINIGIVLTDNDSFPSSALGRLESLHLLWLALYQPDELLRVDDEHIELCVVIAAQAHQLVNQGTETSSITSLIRGALDCGLVRNALTFHLAAQNASQSALEEALEIRARQNTMQLRARSDGYWLPPQLDSAKAYVKDWQSRVTEARPESFRHTAETQIGLRLLVSPGEPVKRNQSVAELRFSNGFEPQNVPTFLEGTVVREPTPRRPQLLCVYEG
jgi:thymidine phosphorylase